MNPIKDYTTKTITAPDDSSDLFADDWGRRGHFSLLSFGPGVDMSAFVTQCAYDWALGRSGVFGVKPKHPLRIGVIQAEDDDSKIAAICHCNRAARRKLGTTPEEIKDAERRILDFSGCFPLASSAKAFGEALNAALHSNPVDVVVAYPLQAYLDFDLLHQHREVMSFVRRILNGLLVSHGVMMLACVRHNGATLSARGGGELINCSRSITEIGRKVEVMFSLTGLKRGGHLGYNEDRDIYGTYELLKEAK